MSKTIVCLGDSVTCNWESPSYPEFLQELIDQHHLPYQIINSGINGEIAQDGYYRLPTDVIAHKPNIVTVMFGHNEIFNGLGVDHWHRYTNLIIQKINHHLPHSELWLLTPNKVNNKQQAAKYQSLLDTLRQSDDRFSLIDIWQEFADQNLDSIYTDQFGYDGLVGLDWLHPNSKGHLLIAQTLFNKLSKIS